MATWVATLVKPPTAARFAEESARTAAASDVANSPAVTNDCSTNDTAGVESARKQRNQSSTSYPV